MTAGLAASFDPLVDRIYEVLCDGRGAFRALADIGFQVAQPAPKPAKPRKRHVPPKHGLSIPERDFPILRDMAESATWAEVGGRAVGAMNDFEERALGVRTREEMNAEGQGRTRWIGMPQWARGFGMNRDAIRNAVERAIHGERLGKKQARLVQAMLDTINGIVSIDGGAR